MKTDCLSHFEKQVWSHLRPLRGQAVILDADLAWFLGLEPAQIIDAVREHPECFPPDFVFRLSPEEWHKWQHKGPCVTGQGLPSGENRFAFTTHGASMLLLVFSDEPFALAAIPVLRAFAKFWETEEELVKTGPHRVNRKS